MEGNFVGAVYEEDISFAAIFWNRTILYKMFIWINSEVLLYLFNYKFSLNNLSKCSSGNLKHNFERFLDNVS